MMIVAMSTDCSGALGKSITDFVGSTSKDDALVDDVMMLRRLLRDSPIVRGRLEKLQAQRAVATWSARLAYYAGVDRLSRQLEGAWSDPEIHRLIDMLAQGRMFDGEMIERRIPATLVIAAGRSGNGKQLALSTIEFVGRSLELKCEGMTATEADEQVACENHGVKNAQAVAVYRKRLRDRLGKPPAAQPIRECDHGWRELAPELVALSLSLPSSWQWHRSARECSRCGLMQVG